MSRNLSALKRGWSYDITNSRMDCYVDAVKMFYLDASNTEMLFDGIDLQLNDSDYLRFGDAAGGDVNVTWNASALAFLPATDDTGSITVGDGTTDIDVKVFLGAASKYVLFDVGSSYLSLINTYLYAPNISTTAGTAGLVYVNVNGYLIQSD